MDAGEALRHLSQRSPSLSLANVALLLESFHRAGGGQYADVVSETALAIQNIIAIRNHASAKASQSLQAAKMIPPILGFVLFIMMTDPVTRDSFHMPLAQIVIALAMGVMLAGYLVMRNEVVKVV
jgi:Flp pilus assembly protein TadB